MIFSHRELRTVKTIARRAASNYGLDADELHGVLQLWMCESYKYVEKYRLEPGGGAKLAASLFRHANKWARAEASAKVIVYKPQQDLEESLYDHKEGYRALNGQRLRKTLDMLAAARSLTF